MAWGGSVCGECIILGVIYCEGVDTICGLRGEGGIRGNLPPPSQPLLLPQPTVWTLLVG